jgi:hypothetical protein
LDDLSSSRLLPSPPLCDLLGISVLLTSWPVRPGVRGRSLAKLS